MWNPDFSKCYFYMDELMPWTWNEANERCAALDHDNMATLTSVRSKEESDYIFSLIGIHLSFWIGGTDAAEEGVWRWVNSNITLSKSIACSPVSQSKRHCPALLALQE